MVGKVVGITVVVAVVGGIALAPTMERRGENNARTFCLHATVGRPMQEIVALAEAAAKRPARPAGVVE